MLMAAELLKTNTSNIISFGDRKIDIISSNLAGIESVACLWDSDEEEEIKTTNPTFLIYKPTEIVALIN